ncbi:hypothetical protein LLG96_06605 [bacterium]|nr:hypothetical protein [bacterium]
MNRYLIVPVVASALLLIHGICGAQTQNLDDVMTLIKSVEEKIQALDEQQKQSVPSKIAQLEQQIEQIRNTTRTDTESINGIATEIRTLMAELRNNMNQPQKPDNPPQPVPAPNKQDKSISDKDFRVFWNNGVCMNTADKAFQFRIGARIMNDWTFMSGQDKVTEKLGPLDDGTEFRRAWIQFSGLAYGNTEFNALLGLNSGKPEILDVYVGLKNIPGAGNIRIGHFKEPIGLEQLMSSNDLSFVERSFAHALNPFRNTGVMLSNSVIKGRATWAAGAFRESDTSGNGSGDGKYNYTVRLSGLPLFTEKGVKLIHIGASYSYRNPLKHQIQYKSRNETHLGPYFVNTGTLNTDSINLINAEAAGIYSRAYFQGEYISSEADMTTGDNAGFSSYYIMGSIFLTPHHRAYKQSSGTFGGAVMDEKSFFGNGGCGAWEATVRYSNIDLTDGAVNGGEATDITIGLNWYLNQNTRVMVNYIYSDLDDTGKARALLMRFQFNM